MHSKSDTKEIRCKADEAIKNLSKLLLNKYQSNLKTSMRGSDFISDCVRLFCYI